MNCEHWLSQVLLRIKTKTINPHKNNYKHKNLINNMDLKKVIVFSLFGLLIGLIPAIIISYSISFLYPLYNLILLTDIIGLIFCGFQSCSKEYINLITTPLSLSLIIFIITALATRKTKTQKNFLSIISILLIAISMICLISISLFETTFLNQFTDYGKLISLFLSPILLIIGIVILYKTLNN